VPTVPLTLGPSSILAMPPTGSPSSGPVPAPLPAPETPRESPPPPPPAADTPAAPLPASPPAQRFGPASLSKEAQKPPAPAGKERDPNAEGEPPTE
jgi:hypothetical protein